MFVNQINDVLTPFVGGEFTIDDPTTLTTLSGIINDPQGLYDAIVSECPLDEWEPTSITGMTGNYDGGTVWSRRATVVSQEAADKISLSIPEQTFTEDDMMDVTGTWRCVGVSPVFRFIHYSDGGYLIPHYDAPYVYDDNKMTLLSFVMYVTPGTTRFLEDDQGHTPVDMRNLNDKDENYPVRPIATIDGGPGDAIVFPHRRLHDSAPVDGEKMIIRTDVIFRKVD